MTTALLVLTNTQPAQAQTSSQTATSTVTSTGDQPDVADDADVTAVTQNFTPSLAGLQPLLADHPQLVIDPPDLQSLVNNKVDVRVTQYLLDLVGPAPAGAGFDHIKVSNILHGYDTDGVGKYDRETLDANPEDPGLISTHNTGQAVDITEIGQITCQLVFHSHFGDLTGGNKTTYSPPTPIKVAWQTVEGQKNSPTPNGQSLVGAAQALTLDNLATYVNASGNADATIDYLKGSDLPTMAEYVGINVLLKNLGYGAGQITNDPLVSTVINAIGANVLVKQLPGLPPGINGANPAEGVPISVGKAQVESGLGLPPGSLSGYGWDGLLNSVGKRAIEQAIGLPTRYLDSHSLQDLNGSTAAQAAFGYVKRSDDALNLPAGTIALLKKNDTNGLKLAGINLLAQAFKLSPDQKQILVNAVTKNQTPTLNPETFNTDNQLSVDGLKSYLAASPGDQQKAQDELRNLGLNILQKAIAKSVPSQYTGLTQQLLNQILNPGSTIKLGDLETNLGAHQLANQAGLDPSKVAGFISNPNSSTLAGPIASSLNQLFKLSGSAALSTSDIGALFKNDYSGLLKIGAAELEKAIGWKAGTGVAVVNGQIKLGDAMGSALANTIGSLLGLSGNPFSLASNSQDFGTATILQRLGIVGINGSVPDAATLLTQIGVSQFQQLFGVRSLDSSTLGNASGEVKDDWQQTDLLLGVPDGTTANYLGGKVGGPALAKTAGDAGLGQVGSSQLWDELGLPSVAQPSNGDFATLINIIKNGGPTKDQQNQLLTLALKFMGRAVDAKANFPLDSFVSFLTATNPQDQTKFLMDQGLKLLVKAFGFKLDNISFDQFNVLGVQLKDLYNTDIGVATNDSGASGDVTNFLFKAFGLPDKYKSDAHSIITGDFPFGLAAASFGIWQDAVNPYLPATSQLTYPDLRSTLIFDDQAAVNQKVQDIIKQGGGTTPSGQAKVDLFDIARQLLISQAKQSTQYLISDGFLGKADPTIPVGFTNAMFNGTDVQRGQILQQWAFNNLDGVLKGADGSYVPGTLQALFNGTADQKQAALILNIASHANLVLGPLSGPVMTTFLQYLTSPKNVQPNFFTDNTSNTAMWSSVNGWLGSTVGVGNLPPNTAQAIYFASQNGWDFNKSLTGPNGTVLAPSLNSLGQGFVTNTISSWGDKQFRLPAGTIVRTYQAVKAVGDASNALAAAHAAGDAAKTAQASNNLSKAQASLAVFVITTAINMDPGLQKLFLSVDQAIQAPPGFTNAVVAGAISMAFGLGPAGLYIAAAIYVFGVYKVSYLCPTPPKDLFSTDGFDQGGDILTYKWGDQYNDPATPILATPAPGQDVATWAKDVQFVNGDDPKLWMAWARYFTGKLLDSVLTYSTDQDDLNKTRQVITDRQANAEFFSPRTADAFGSDAVGNPKVGLGYSQTSTKTTDWVHLGFGGYY